MRFKLLHAADLHLDSPLRGLERYEGAPAERIRGASRRAFTNLVDLCLEEGVKVALFSGDLFDGDWQDYSSGLFFVRELARLRAGNARVIWIRGNHDAASKIRKSLRLPDNVQELSVRRAETVELPELGVAVHGQGYASPSVLDDIAARYPAPVRGAFNVGLLHTALTGRAGHEPYAPCRLEALVDRGYDYWALGHVHQREVVSTAPWVVFPGNLQGRHARETGAKGATLVTVEDGRVLAVEERALDVVRWHALEVDLSGAQRLDDALDRVRGELFARSQAAEGRLVAARVSLTGATPAHAALLRQGVRVADEVRALALDLGAGELWVEKVRLLTTPEIDLGALRRRDDAVGHIAAALFATSEDASELAALARSLDELRAKLPPELVEGPDAAPLVTEDDVRGLVADVERLLLARLVAEEAP